MTLYPKLITDALQTVHYPGSDKSIVQLGMVDDNIRIDGNHVSFSLLFTKNPDPFAKSIVKAAQAAIRMRAGEEVEVEIQTVFAQQQDKQEAAPLLPDVKNIIAVSSGKGGVGKSTVSANLAVALARLGYRVGLLDADVFGPSIPKMFQLEDFQPCGEMVDGRQLIVPAQQYGVKIVSIGFFIKPNNAAVWRGPMASNALKQLIGQVNWGPLDYFIIDTPPGTGDIHLTLMQNLALTGAVIVSTPQKVALADARKGIDMYRNEQINVPILGLVENMAWFTPAEHPDERYYLFGRDGAKNLAEEMHLPLLGQVPIVQSICESGDSGTPIATDAEDATGKSFLLLAQNLMREIIHQKKQGTEAEKIQMKK